MRIINCPIRNNLNFASWNLVADSTDVFCIPGGTISQGNQSIMADAELVGIASVGNKVIYSVNLNRSPQNEVVQLERVLAAGIQLHGIRFGNEEYGDVNLQGLGSEAAYAFGVQSATAYLALTVPYVDIFSAYPGVRIFNTAYPSNQFPVKFNSYREGWNFKIYNSILPTNVVDFHIYDRFVASGPIDFTYLKQYKQNYPNSIYTIEAGVVSDTAPSDAAFIERSIYVMQEQFKILTGKHAMGIQLMEQVVLGIGLVYQGVVTEIGQAWIDLIKTVPIDPNNPIDPTDPTEPGCIFIEDISPIVQGFFIGNWIFLKLILSNGDIKNWWGKADVAPKIGDCIEGYFPDIDFSKSSKKKVFSGFPPEISFPPIVVKSETLSYTLKNSGETTLESSIINLLLQPLQPLVKYAPDAIAKDSAGSSTYIPAGSFNTFSDFYLKHSDNSGTILSYPRFATNGLFPTIQLIIAGSTYVYETSLFEYTGISLSKDISDIAVTGSSGGKVVKDSLGVVVPDQTPLGIDYIIQDLTVTDGVDSILIPLSSSPFDIGLGDVLNSAGVIVETFARLGDAIAPDAQIQFPDGNKIGFAPSGGVFVVPDVGNYTAHTQPLAHPQRHSILCLLT